MMALVRRDFTRAGYDIWIMPLPFAAVVKSPSGRALNLPPDLHTVVIEEAGRHEPQQWSKNVTVGFVSDHRLAEMITEQQLKDIAPAEPPMMQGLIEARYAQPAHAELFGRTLAYLLATRTPVSTGDSRGWPWTEAWMKGEMWIDLDKLDAPADTPVAVASGYQDDVLAAIPKHTLGGISISRLWRRGT